MLTQICNIPSEEVVQSLKQKQEANTLILVTQTKTEASKFQTGTKFGSVETIP